jgi:hypothetical protein
MSPAAVIVPELVTMPRGITLPSIFPEALMLELLSVLVLRGAAGGRNDDHAQLVVRAPPATPR